MENETHVSINTFSMSEDSNGFLLWKVSNLWQRELKNHLDPFGLTHCQFSLLASVYWNNQFKEQVTQVDLSEHTRIDPMTTSTVVRTLEKKGLISRTEHTTDTRAKALGLTPQGIDTLEKAIQSVEAFEEQFFNLFKDKNEDLRQTLQLLLNYSR
ncbi:MarR family transcriptional regulator [Siphonobacter sp. BAB-5385]|uniref:MarR family winged helix-turn-helix transcriptional regulator n=1 Tax=unclassified Siphonobacter TaxID=2635712 RepID=UPI000B9EC153|nr:MULTISPECIES: MarR family transcriptional regulator [unclassified Siphonobacter]OZI06526.1 MarR family transcriptional regulator [Siphonobacter sp. BAB-5385]PMD91667.1 MarR family transcriptional regulator [Siphonobacter sp. BAB-5405]